MLGSCVLAAPQMSITFASVVLLGGGTWDDVKKKVKQDIPETWVMGNVFWVPICSINGHHCIIVLQSVVLLVVRTLQVLLVVVFWNIYLARQSTKPIKDN